MQRIVPSFTFAFESAGNSMLARTLLLSVDREINFE